VPRPPGGKKKKEELKDGFISSRSAKSSAKRENPDEKGGKVTVISLALLGGEKKKGGGGKRGTEEIPNDYLWVGAGQRNQGKNGKGLANKKSHRPLIKEANRRKRGKKKRGNPVASSNSTGAGNVPQVWGTRTIACLAL